MDRCVSLFVNGVGELNKRPFFSRSKALESLCVVPAKPPISSASIKPSLIQNGPVLSVVDPIL